MVPVYKKKKKHVFSDSGIPFSELENHMNQHFGLPQSLCVRQVLLLMLIIEKVILAYIVVLLNTVVLEPFFGMEVLGRENVCFKMAILLGI